MSQTSFWQTDQQNTLQTNLQSKGFAELCNAFYERELRLLANTPSTNITSIQGRLKSLPYYINRTAHLMLQVKIQEITPLVLDIHNASWSAKQANNLPLAGQTADEVLAWYLSKKLTHGIVVPILSGQRIILDCIDRVDIANKRFRTNVSGWFSLSETIKETNEKSQTNNLPKLLKPNKKVMLAACAGHCWQITPHNTFYSTTDNKKSTTNARKLQPIIPSLRELLLSCAINWKDFKQPLAL